ncbi:WD40 repeat-like protein [Calocera cornea HHB12733]|uniref:Elongator complex protein 2 n=1 Tax=Calocera cornea HHB12733 TaxID=1353952 RepID=A0A165JWA6_9BASI|nr:WD40 repeat-like protein [Calocera cornea HHB12733]
MAFSSNEVTLDYVSIGCNRFTNAADCSPEDLVAFGAGRFVALWKLTTGSRGIYRTLPGHTNTVTTVKFLRCRDDQGTPRSTGLVSGDASGEVIVWKAEGDEWVISSRIKDHTASISAVGIREAMVPSGTVGGYATVLMTGASDGTVKVWKVSNETALVQTLNLKGKYPLDLALTVLPGVNLIILAIACTDRKIQIWAQEGDEFRYRLSLEGHEDWIRCLAFVTETRADPQQRIRTILASGSQDGYIRLWTIASMKPDESKPNCTTHGGLSNDLLEMFEKSLSEGGSGQISTKAHVLAFENGKYSVTFDALLLGHEGWITGLHWHPAIPSSSGWQQPLVLLTSASDNSLIMWSQDSDSSIWLNRQRFGDIVGKGMGFFGALWGNDGCDVLAHAWNGSFHRWHIHVAEAEHHITGSWEPALAVTGHSQPVRDIAWEPHGRYVLSCSTDQTSRIHGPWRSEPSGSESSEITWHELARPQIHGYDLVTGAFLDPFCFVSASDEKVARVFEAPGTFVRTLRASHLINEDVSTGGRPAAATVPALGLSNKVTDQGMHAVYCRATNRLRAITDDATAALDDEELSKRPPVESELALVTLWPEIEKIFGHGYELFALATSPDQKFVATSCKSTTPEHAVIRVYTTVDWQQFGAPLAGHALTITRIAFSPSGRYILTVSRDRSWRLFELGGDGFQPVASEKAHARIIWDCAWGTDDALFATAARDKTVKIWRRDVASWKATSTVKLGESATAVDLLSISETSHLVLAVGLETGQIEFYIADRSGEKWKKVRVVDSDLAHVHEIHRLRWSPAQPAPGSNMYQLASCSEDGSLRIFTIKLHL